MCGIFGFIGFDDKNLLKRMAGKLEHRGPDDKGFYSDGICSLGNTRLSIIDLERGKQPIHNEERTIWVVFNGEIYNYRELRKQLDKKHSFYTDSDTEVIVHLYEEYGEDFLKYLDGMFAIALWDLEDKKLVLARDRTGIKPLYYALVDNGFIFASEIKALLEFEEIKKVVNKKSVASFLMYRFVFGENTIIEDIKKLEPGHILVRNNNNMKIEAYWNLTKSEKTPKKAEAELLEILSSSVKKRMISDVPISALLSGGLDSSTVVGLMSKMTDKVKTFTVGFDVEGDEFDRAKYVSDYFNTEHKEVIVDVDDIIRDFEKMVWYMDEAVADTAMIPSFYASAAVGKEIKVALVGEGADEVFGGYLPYKLLSEKVGFLPWKLREKIYFHYSTALTSKEIRGIIGKDFGVKQYFIEDISSKPNLNSVLLFDIKNVLPNYQLTRVDRMMMAHSVEARVPFLDAELLRFSFSLPERKKVKLFEGKHILRRAVSGILPNKIVKQVKRPFFTPLGYMYEKGFYDYLISKYESSEFMKKAIPMFKKRRNNKRNLWKLFLIGILSSWMRQYLTDSIV